ncbi:hypothetical protein K440DRAFT_613991 [Wilcoxina mikolae CBS 423.85]|nr:hypothetical protein K440DRAFT_613991 [Wilcoxina mikolae CBS 423.85]
MGSPGGSHAPDGLLVNVSMPPHEAVSFVYVNLGGGERFVFGCFLVLWRKSRTQAANLRVRGKNLDWFI